MNITEDYALYKCDKCEGEFVGRDAALKPVADNADMVSFSSAFKFVDKNNIITGGRAMPRADKGDKVLACPVCGAVHLFGFDMVKK